MGKRKFPEKYSYNKFQALKRSPQFKKDLKNTIYPFPKQPGLKGFSLKKIKAFEKKYALTLLPNNSYGSIDDCVKLMEAIMLEDELFDDFTVRAVPVETAEFVDGANINGKASWDYNKDPFITNNKYLTLEIDLTKNKGEIISRVSDYIDHFCQKIDKPVSRNTLNEKMLSSFSINPHLVSN
jgi:hypothetical protein